MPTKSIKPEFSPPNSVNEFEAFMLAVERAELAGNERTEAIRIVWNDGDWESTVGAVVDCCEDCEEYVLAPGRCSVTGEPHR